MLRRLWERLMRPFREQPTRMGLVLIAVGLIDYVLSRGFGIGVSARDTSWLTEAPILTLGAALVLYGWRRRLSS